MAVKQNAGLSTGVPVILLFDNSQLVVLRNNYFSNEIFN